MVSFCLEIQFEVPGEKRNWLARLSLIDLKWPFLVIAFPLCKTKKEATKTDFFCLKFAEK
jgi:hypothetical protein